MFKVNDFYVRKFDVVAFIPKKESCVLARKCNLHWMYLAKYEKCRREIISKEYRNDAGFITDIELSGCGEYGVLRGKPGKCLIFSFDFKRFIWTDKADVNFMPQIIGSSLACIWLDKSGKLMKSDFKENIVLPTNRASIKGFNVSPDGKICIYYLANSLHIVDLQTNKVVNTQKLNFQISAATFSHDNSKYAVAGVDKQVQVYEVAGGKLAQKPDCFKIDIAAQSLAMSSDGLFCAVADARGSICVYGKGTNKYMLLSTRSTTSKLGKQINKMTFIKNEKNVADLWFEVDGKIKYLDMSCAYLD